MTKIYKYVWIIAMLLPWGNLLARESETQRAFLAKYLHFYYIESPNKISLAYRLDNAMIAQKNTCTKCGNFWTNPNTKHAKDLLRALFRDAGQGGDLKLQQYAYHIVKAPYTDPKPVQIWIYDDLKEPLNQHALAVYAPCESEKGHVWPCAAGLKASGFERYGGFMHLGTSYMHKKGLNKTKATFLHELTHTQDHMVAETDVSHLAQPHASHLHEPNLWLLKEAGQQSKYPVIEAAPSWPLAYREALANTFDLIYNPDEAKRIYQWYLANALLLIDATYHKETSAMSEEEWLYHRISKDMGKEGTSLSAQEYDPLIARYYRGFRMNDLPKNYIIRNEMIMALMFYGYIKYVGLDKFKAGIVNTNQMITGDERRAEALKKLSIHERRDPFRVLFNQLNISGRPSHIKNLNSMPTSSAQGPKPHLLLMAYVDYFTRYRIQSKEEFAKLFGIEYGNGKYTGNSNHDMFIIYVDLYWAQAKDKVRSGVTLFDAEFGDLALIAKVLDVPVPGQKVSSTYTDR